MKAKAKIYKFKYQAITDLFIQRVDCTEINIIQLINLFKFENVVVGIDDVNKNDPLFLTMDQHNFKYTTSFDDGSLYTDVILLTNIYNLEIIIHRIFESEIESFFITNIANQSQWEQFLYNRTPVRKLIKNEILDFHIGVIVNEAQIEISFNNNKYDFLNVVQEVKKIF